jgi:hypothetical protein
MARLVVDTWDPAYGTGYALDEDLAAPDVDLAVEHPAGEWVAVGPPEGGGASEVLFVDGVQRVDARVTLIDGDRSTAGMAGSFAAGAVRHNPGKAVVEQVAVRRGLFTHASDVTLDCGRGVVYSPFAVAETTPDAMVRAMTEQMRALEKVIAADAAAELVVIDGPLSGGRHVAGAVGLVKTHHRRYLEEGSPQERLVATLEPRQRTPVFLAVSSYTRYSWYLRLPGPVAHPWSGIVRCEASGDVRRAEVLRLAGVTAATLPRFASSPHRDPRAPQNLTPVGELERRLRHRLGDPAVLERLLRRTCSTWTP